MKLTTLLSSLALGGTLVLGGALLAPSFAADERPAAGERQWLSIPQIHEKLEAAGYRKIEKIEREHGGYEVRATDRNGERIKLYVNPQSGEISDRHGHGRRDREAGGAGGTRQRDNANCNERRCRDDLPASTAKPVPGQK